MIYDKYNPFLNKVKDRFEKLYGAESAEKCLARFKILLGRYELGVHLPDNGQMWTEKDVVLITYADSVVTSDDKPLNTLKRFSDSHLKDAISHIHILPFYPYSSDDGFSVIHYRFVNQDYGDWTNLKDLGENFKLMFDLVLNHASKRSGWFIDYNEGIAPARDYFITVKKQTKELSKVVRPRNLPLLTETLTKTGKKLVWTTFSDDQIDLNYANPDVLFEMLDILLFYSSMGAKIIRLDAIAYLWKEIGTSCIHLPQTHEIVKLMRDLVDVVAPDVVLLTETNVPQKENYSYFGNGDEAHMIYQFSLPPLVLLSFIREDASLLTQWASKLEQPAKGMTFLNFTASHDGIGVRPLEGIASQEEMNELVEHVKAKGGLVSYKRNSDDTQSPYELNISWLSAITSQDCSNFSLQMKRFLCSQMIPLSLKGVPAVYVNNLLFTENDQAAYAETKMPRSLNRHKWRESEIEKHLLHDTSEYAKYFSEYLNNLKIRRSISAFHPDSPQEVADFGKEFFCVARGDRSGTNLLFAIHNLTSKEQVFVPHAHSEYFAPVVKLKDALTSRKYNTTDKEWVLTPYEVLWLSPA